MMISLAGRRVVVVGGGRVACRRAEVMLAAGADVCVVAPRLDPAFAELPVSYIDRAFRPDDLENTFLVVIATDDPQVNVTAAREARRRNVLINRTDEPDGGDVVIPAHAHRGPLTVAVHTGGISARAAADIRDVMLEALDRDYLRLLETIAPFRDMFKQRLHDPDHRRRALRRLADDKAMAVLKAEGEPGLRQHCKALLKEAARAETTDQSR